MGDCEVKASCYVSAENDFHWGNVISQINKNGPRLSISA